MSTTQIFLPLLLLVGACKPPPDARQQMPGASVERGKAVIERVGCGACHIVPGISWPQGRIGPALGNFAGQNLIAGQLPNRPDILAAFIRNAPALVPDTNMPAMPLSEQESRDVAAYLYRFEDL
ncbi:c-type cytochrome [Sphingosinicella rhizophila]|uniref:C-type cytochrome n=1 Tax=Sphingosinicella rhizophila TaxID=3050082 RepID=A0ABU3Q694_9SPHN|nr:c-type cytochrome [Sphingosinicella sp. GR2756]MDT9598925.1 c-type cytochrome [Sphingosinicella sp. GR2756]